MSEDIIYNEEELLKRVTEGNETAFTELFYAYHQRLGAYVFRLTGSVDLAEEVVQEVFLKIWIRRADLAEVSSFSSYLYAMSRNHTFNCLRSIANEEKKKAALKERLLTEGQEDFPESYYQIIDRAIEKLPPQQQKVYILSRRKRLKYDEIARRMNISRETVKKYLQLATRSIICYARNHGDLLLLLVFILFI